MTVEKFKRLLLRNSGNDWRQTMFNDAFMQSLVEKFKTVDTQAYRPSAVFLNGKYYGLYNIRERFDEFYFETHYDINREDLVILEGNGSLYRGNNSDTNHYLNMLQFIEENSLENDSNFAYINTLMDTENYRDYFASQIFFGNRDWPHNNIKFWRKTTKSYEENAPYGHDGRWRWLLFDLDHGFYWSDSPFGAKSYPINHYHNTIDFVMGELDGRYEEFEWPNFLFRSLMKNQQFEIDFLNRISDLMNSYFATEVLINQIDLMVEGIENEMPAHIKRWGAIESMEERYKYIDRKYVFARERPEILRKFIMDEFDIEDTIEINIGNETEMGYIRINTIDINSELPGNNSEDSWSGTYFTNLPITLELSQRMAMNFLVGKEVTKMEKKLK